MRRIKIIQQPGFLAQLLPELLKRRILGFINYRCNILHRQQLTLQAPGLLACVAFIHPGNDLTLRLEILNRQIDIEREQRHTAGHQQARQDNADGRKAHKPVMKNTAHALLQEIAKAHTVLHIRNTHLFGH